MNSQEHLLQIFRADEIDHSDLSHIVLMHFSNASDISPTEVVFGMGADPNSFALKFIYKKRRLAQILAGASLKPEDVSAIKSKIDLDLQEPAATKVSTQVLFTQIPISGCFRYRDVFQILPVPAGSPCGHRHFGGNPFLVQFTFRSSSEPMLYSARREAQGRRIHFLLNSLLETSVSRLTGSRFHWVLVRNVPNQSQEAAYCQEMYTFPESGKFLDGDSFSPIDGISQLVGIAPQEYYTRDVVLNDAVRVLEVPANLEILLDRFFSSSSDDQDRFLRACFWFNHARTTSGYSDSARFTALLSALESLMPDERPGPKCPSCQRSVGKGSVRRLTELLDQFAPATPSFQEARAKLYYEFRSRLSHGGALSFSDRRAVFFGLTPEAIEERTLSLEVRLLVKIVLVNWLNSRSPLLVTVRRG